MASAVKTAGGVEFGISLTGKTGMVIAETTGQAHFKINLEWERRAAAGTGG